MGTHPIFESDFDCLTDTMSRGVSRIEQRLKSKIDSGDFYEAHQMYRTIASRYKTAKKIGDALALTHDGAIVLYEKDQNGSASDLGLLFCSMLDEATELSSKIIGLIKGLHRRTIEKLDEEQPERDQFEKRILQRSIDLSGEKYGCPEVRLAFAQNYFDCIRVTNDSKSGTRMLVNARGHFQFSNDGHQIAQFLVAYSKFGAEHEVEYFCCQMVLQLLHRKTPETANSFFQHFCSLHPTLKGQSLPFSYPLINFTHFLLSSIKDINAEAFSYLKSAYEPLLVAPDPSLRFYCDEIGEIYFGIRRKKAQNRDGGLFGMIQNMMGGMSNGDSEDDSEDDAGPGQGIDMNSIMNMANNMISGMVNQGQNRQPTQRPQRVAPRASAAPPAAEEDVDDLD